MTERRNMRISSSTGDNNGDTSEIRGSSGTTNTNDQTDYDHLLRRRPAMIAQMPPPRTTMCAITLLIFGESINESIFLFITVY